MNRLLHIIAPLLALILLAGCGSENEWRLSYRTLSEQTWAALPPEASIELVDCSTFADELYLDKVHDAQDSATPVGSSNFTFDRTRGYGSKIESEYVPELEQFARSIGADLVLYRIQYIGSDRARELDTWDTPRTDTSYITTTRRNPDGTKSRSTTTVTSTSWETRLISRTVSIDRYSASAAYFRRGAAGEARDEANEPGQEAEGQGDEPSDERDEP
ncbi:MAG: hypothetical protein IT430_17920 [Phycisphaerales bacterium]|nr:hypothetical protein [Phycisphaerales bacterium]